MLDMFSQSFTREKNGQGFRSQASVLPASELAGSLSCAIPGHGPCASFILDLPLTFEQACA